MVQRALDNGDVTMDKMLDNLHVRKIKVWGDEDSKSCAHTQGRPLVGAWDIVDFCKETQLLLKCSPETPPINTVQKRWDTEYAQCGQWPMSEFKKSPESSQFQLKWPPEGSSLKLVPERSGTIGEDAEHGEEDNEKRMFSQSRKRSMTEIHKDPEFAWFLPKWPPEGSTFVRSGEQSVTDHQKNKSKVRGSSVFRGYFLH